MGAALREFNLNSVCTDDSQPSLDRRQRGDLVVRSFGRFFVVAQRRSKFSTATGPSVQLTLQDLVTQKSVVKGSQGQTSERRPESGFHKNPGSVQGH